MNATLNPKRAKSVDPKRGRSLMISHDPEAKRFAAIETGWIGGEIEAREVTRAEAEEIMAAIFDAAFPTEPSRFAKRVTGNPDSHAGELQDGA